MFVFLLINFSNEQLGHAHNSHQFKKHWERARAMVRRSKVAAATVANDIKRCPQQSLLTFSVLLYLHTLLFSWAWCDFMYANVWAFFNGINWLLYLLSIISTMLSDLDLKTDDGDDDSKTKKEVKCSMAKSDHLGRYLIYIICEQVSECVWMQIYFMRLLLRLGVCVRECVLSSFAFCSSPFYSAIKYITCFVTIGIYDSLTACTYAYTLHTYVDYCIYILIQFMVSGSSVWKAYTSEHTQ